jgi:hypothetical protein
MPAECGTPRTPAHRTAKASHVPFQETDMAFSVFDSKGTPLDRQRYTWRDMVRQV